VRADLGRQWRTIGATILYYQAWAAVGMGVAYLTRNKKFND